jgi:hypothetical protein
MFKEANEFIDMVEEYEWDYANIQVVESDFNTVNPAQVNIKILMKAFLREHGLSRYMESEVLDALPIVMLSREVSYWAFRTIEIFWDEYDFAAYENGYMGGPLSETIEELMGMKVKLQRFARRFLARNRLSPIKRVPLTDETCAICIGMLDPRFHIPTPCGHLFHIGCIREWKRYNFTCPMCRNELA